MGSEALALDEGSAGASQIQPLPLQPLHVEPPVLKPLEHLPLVARGFPRTAATSGHAVRESSRAPLKLFPPGEGSFEQNRRDDFPGPSLLYSSSPSQLLPNLPALLLLAWLCYFFRICKGLGSICCKFGRAGAEAVWFPRGNQAGQRQGDEGEQWG